MLVFGTRPEAIKMAPLCRKLKDEKSIKLYICITAQHREMLDQVLKNFDLIPDIDLDIMTHGQDLSDINANILIMMRDVIKEYMPNLVLVHGDTTTSFAVALACFYMGIKVGHVEAGLRTYNLKEPFPEEYNRQSTGLLADYHFAPTELSYQNLIKEGKKKEKIVVTGNTVIDALHLMLDTIDKNPKKSLEISEKLDSKLGFCWKSNKFILITGHRRENFGSGFIDICTAIKDLAILNKDIHFVYPVHLNPNVQEPVLKILNNIDNIWLVNPLEYQEFVYLLRKSYIVLTDSGGIQEEAPSLGKPVVVMRDKTERPEALEAGTVKLVGTNKNKIISIINRLINDKSTYSKMSLAHNPYGDGMASNRIKKYILDNINEL